MTQQGQILPLAGRGTDGTRWAYRYRLGGRGSRRVQRGGFGSEQAAAEALERGLERLRREQGLVESRTLAEFVEVYLTQHEGEPETTEKLRWLLQKAVRVFGERRLGELRSPAIAAWRMTIAPGTGSKPRRRSARCSPGRSAGGCSRSTRPSSGSRTRSGAIRRSGPFDSWDEVYALAGRARRALRPDGPLRRGHGCARRSGWRSRTGTSTARPRSSTSTAGSGTVASRRPRRRRASAPFPCRRSRSQPSTSYRQIPTARSPFPPSAAVTSTCTTSAPFQKARFESNSPGQNRSSRPRPSPPGARRTTSSPQGVSARAASSVAGGCATRRLSLPRPAPAARARARPGRTATTRTRLYPR